ncbi:MAG: prepilin-type N-terminal cleavage/methylation domain-containing protein [bacterium]|nr:prepilin-type N-terminal cleavage/methylation domain-containing protein [bacterium]
MRKTYSRGFTLVEILVVIAILTILAGVISVSIKGAKEKAENISRQIVIENYADAINFYRIENGGFPHQKLGNGPNDCKDQGNSAFEDCRSVCLADSPGSVAKECILFKNNVYVKGTDSYPQDAVINGAISKWVAVQPPFKDVEVYWIGDPTKNPFYFQGPIYLCKNITAKGICDSAWMAWVFHGTADCTFGEKGDSGIFVGATWCFYDFKL